MASHQKLQSEHFSMQGRNCGYFLCWSYTATTLLTLLKAACVRYDSQYRLNSCSFEKYPFTLWSFSQWNCNCNFQCAPNHIMSCSWFASCDRKSRIFNILGFGLCAMKKHLQKCRQLDGAVAGRSRLIATVRGSLLKHISQIFYCLYFCESHWPPSALHAIVIFLFPFAILCKPVFVVHTKKC